MIAGHRHPTANQRGAQCKPLHALARSCTKLRVFVRLAEGRTVSLAPFDCRFSVFSAIFHPRRPLRGETAPASAPAAARISTGFKRFQLRAGASTRQPRTSRPGRPGIPQDAGRDSRGSGCEKGFSHQGTLRSSRFAIRRGSVSPWWSPSPACSSQPAAARPRPSPGGLRRC
jgi:hypothetical protein